MKTISLYRKTGTNEIFSRYDTQCIFDEILSEETYEEWLSSQHDLEPITATLSDGLHVYPYYFFTDEQDIMTIMDLYAIYQQTDDWKYWKTFADLLNNPQVDRNGVDFYGFYI